MEQIDYIRLETNQKGCTYSDVANRMRIDARTVKKYAIRGTRGIQAARDGGTTFSCNGPCEANY
ncbi:hypothetical protein SAMN04488072_112114 [Lentibacillus halodurans]|uniref:Uncharacterized protein n=1 Tax=Lentibacillus halodurans TaxID=237679 RepID=A0A1I0ZP30_9BACI|nr:hypothetical protein [Lentibacillus halodurans]SFB27474.1 hypothetical protein SAMN04488072_112114 [Lentibacillus halodurans]